ncbi:SHOCT domain-containing protein [Vulcanococcus limneticus]|uniref:SHOCT domain-containing protein n=1 Tax=Vulcanococcus limneticus TaxID=2170428 RepID=UPI00398BCCED
MEFEEPTNKELFEAAVDLFKSRASFVPARLSTERSRATPISYVLADDNGTVVKRLAIADVRKHALKLTGSSPKPPDGAPQLATPPEIAATNPPAPADSQPDQTAATQDPTKAELLAPGAFLAMKGRKSIINVFEDRVELTPFGVFGFMAQGLSGTKTIPYESIIAIQFKPVSHLTVGFLQFTLPGGIEKGQGVFNAVDDENTFTFGSDNDKALEIKIFIEGKVKEARNPPAAKGSGSLSEEIEKLSRLLQQGLLTEDEFRAAKKRLLDS